MHKPLISFLDLIACGVFRPASFISFSLRSLSASHLNIHLLPKRGVSIFSISSLFIGDIRVPWGIRTEPACLRRLRHLSPRISAKLPTSTISSINPNLEYSPSRRFSHTSNVLKPSSFAPLRTCNEQWEPSVAIVSLLPVAAFLANSSLLFVGD